jgi:glycine/serine hydroxymethyltransferase
MDLIAELIGRVLAAPDDDTVLKQVHAEVTRLCERFPLHSS